MTLSQPESYLVKFLFQLYADVPESGWALQCHATAFARTMLSLPDS